MIMKRLVDQGLTNKEIQRQVNTSRKSVSLLRGNLKISDGEVTTKPRLSNGAPRALTVGHSDGVGFPRSSQNA